MKRCLSSALGRGIGAGCLLLPAAYCLIAPPAGDANAKAPLVDGSRGKATLAQLAGGPIGLQSRKRVSMREFPFRFPRPAQQGPNLWYMVRMDVRVFFEPNSGPGSVLVSAYTNSAAAAQVEFYTERSRRGRQIVTWDSADAIRGSSGGRFPGTGGQVKYRNYLQIEGVQPGSAVLEFAAERFGQAEISKIELGPASGIYSTLAGPVDLGLDAHLDDDSLEPGQPTTLTVEVKNSSTRIARDVELSVLPISGHLFTRSKTLRQIKEVDGSAVQRFIIGGTRLGELKLEVNAADGSGSEARAVVAGKVANEDGGNGAKWILITTIGLGIGAVVARLLKRRRSA